VNSRAVRIAIGVAVSVVLLWFAVQGVDWGEAAKSVRKANYLWLLPLMAGTIWNLIVRAQRWRLFLKPLGVPSFRTLVAATNIGFMANMVLPLRIGEVIRPALVARRERVPLGGVLATIVLERVFDMFMVLLLFGIAVLVVPVTDQARTWGVMLMGVAAVVGTVVFVMWWQEELALRIVHACCAPLPEKVGGALESFARGFVKALEVLSSPTDFLKAFAWSAYLWGTIALVNMFGLAAFHLPLRSTIIATAIVAIAVSVPSAPGYIGSFQLGCKVALALYGVSPDEAIAFSIVHHLVQFFTIVAAGLFSMWSENMKLGEVGPAEGGTA